MYTTLIETRQLEELLEHHTPLILDCSFALGKPDWGRAEYLQAHIPRAVYVDLEKDLSGPPVTDQGRHPLPAGETLVALFSRLGVSSGRQVVAYDQQQGAFAARLWWMLRYMGHEAVAVLNGGSAAWRRQQLPQRSGEEQPLAAQFEGQPRRGRLVTIDELADVPLLIDARAANRYRGEVEPLYARAGHIPGARNCPYENHLDKHGQALASQEIRAGMMAVIGDTAAAEVVYSCGSGVTACHLLLTGMHSGLEEGRIYIGSFSEWISDPARAVATGDECRAGSVLAL